MALLRQANPATSVADLEQALTASAFDLGTAGVDNVSGYGLIDAVAANDLLVNAPEPTCTDFDGDGFFAQTGCGAAVDCNDIDAGINPDACDIKRDGIDQDCDGLDRFNGKSCPSSGGDGGGDLFGVEGKGKSCSDNIDNDLDGQTDCQDSGCSNNKSCR